jgi:hypothetical protein
VLLLHCRDRRESVDYPLFGRDLNGVRIECLEPGRYEAQFKLRSGFVWPHRPVNAPADHTPYHFAIIDVSEAGGEALLDLSDVAVIQLNLLEANGEPARGTHSFNMGFGSGPKAGERSWGISGSWYVREPLSCTLGLPPGKFWVGPSSFGGMTVRGYSQDIEVFEGDTLVELEFIALE